MYNIGTKTIYYHTVIFNTKLDSTLHSSRTGIDFVIEEILDNNAGAE